MRRDVVAGAPQIPEMTEQATVSGPAELVGAALDGIPENAAIGIGRRWPGPRSGAAGSGLSGQSPRDQQHGRDASEG